MSAPPVKKFKLRRVEAAVWAKEDADDGFVRYSITVQKSYKDKDTGDYVNSTRFFPEEAAVLAILIPQAVCWIAEQGVGTAAAAPIKEEKEKPF